MVVLPPFQIGGVGKNEVGLRARLVEIGREADDKRNLLERACQGFFGWEIGQRIGCEQKQSIHGIGILFTNMLGQELRDIRSQKVLIFARAVDARLGEATLSRTVLFDRSQWGERQFSLREQPSGDADVSHQGVQAVNRHTRV